MATDFKLAERKVLVLMSLIVAVLLLRGPGADLVHAALDNVLGLATRRNTILLFHAILIFVLWDAGLFGTPSRRRAAAAGSRTPGTWYPAERRPRIDDRSLVQEDVEAAMQQGASAEECGEEEEEEEDDLDEMNTRFDAFIADMKKRMQQEELELRLHASGENSREM